MDSRQHTTILRALTSRLSEVRGVGHFWSGGRLTERSYLASLRRLRDECHEWTAADVLRGLQGAEGALELEADLLEASGGLDGGGGGGGGGDGGEGQRVALRRGFPPWSAAYPRCPWLRYVCPVLEALLCSCYEDWLEVGLGACSALLTATAPMLDCAAACSAEDLRLPEAGEGGGEGAAGEEEGGGGAGGLGAAAAQRQRTLRHLAAHGALEFARLAGPLVAALASAAQCPSPATQRTAGAVCTGLRKALHAVAHLQQ